MNEPTKDNALSRIYREGSWPEPGRQIDQAILAASRRAAREQSFVRRWAPSFAVAATVVLTSTLVIKVYREQPEAVSPSVSDNPPATRAKQTDPTAEAKVAEAKSAAAPPPASPPVTTPRGYTSTMDTGEAERLDRLQHDLGLKQVRPASESPLPAPGTGPAEKSAAVLKKEASDAPRASPTPRRPDAPQPAVQSASPPREQPPANAPVSVFGAQPPAPAQPILRAAKPSTQNAPPAARPEAAQPQASETERKQATQPPPASPTPAEAASADSTSGNALAGVVAARITPKAPERSPQTWIEDIRKLVAEGKLEQADREIADFKKRYPDFALPSDLR
jgi:hypothetical protein